MEKKRPRAQVIVHREDKILMVQHRYLGEEWWCLPGGAIEAGETPAGAALRELREECGLHGTIVRQTSHLSWTHDEAFTFLVDVGDQDPSLGHDPEFEPADRILVDVRWLSLREIPERDRAFLFAAGLLGVGEFLSEVASWGANLSYPRG